MAKYESRYLGLSFKVGDELFRFENGEFETDSADVIKVLDGIFDATKLAETKTETETTEAKPAPKAPAKRTASAK